MAEAENPRPTNANNSNSRRSSMPRRSAALDALREARERIEAAEAEMAKEREVVRAEADGQRAAMEAETARIADDALQRITGKSSAGRKRKRAGEAPEEKLVSLREGVLLLGLLQCNLIL